LETQKDEEDPGERQDSLSMPDTRSDKTIKKIITEMKKQGVTLLSQN
jgi:hypothetical protein